MRKAKSAALDTFDALKKTSPKGGPRKGAGRISGKPNAATVEKQALRRISLLSQDPGSKAKRVAARSNNFQRKEGINRLRRKSVIQPPVKFDPSTPEDFVFAKQVCIRLSGN